MAELDALGAPDTESGQEVIDAIDGLSSTVEEQIDEIDRTIESLGDSGAEGVPASTVPAVTEAFATMRTATASALQEIQAAASGNELDDAFEEASSCDPLTGSSS